MLAARSDGEIELLPLLARKTLRYLARKRPSLARPSSDEDDGERKRKNRVKNGNRTLDLWLTREKIADARS